jgi:hypothetical protein
MHCLAIKTRDLSSDSHSVKNELSKGKTIGFAIVIILVLGSLAVAGVGLGGYLQAESLSGLGRVNSIIMMVTGNVSGIVFLIIGIVGAVKNRQKIVTCIVHNRSDRHYSAPNTLTVKVKNTDSIAIESTSTVKVKNTDFIERTRKGQIRVAVRFGKADWETYFGDIGDEPFLSEEKIKEILNSPCPFSGDESVKVRDTHMLVLIPATIDDAEVTLNMLQNLISHGSKKGYKANYRFYDHKSWPKIEHGDTPVRRSYWVLMTRDVIPESRNKSYADQKAMVEGMDYVLPQALEVVVCILAESVASATHLFSRDFETYTGCAESVRGKYPIIVGGFGNDNTLIDYSKSNRESLGACAVRRQF